MANTRFRIVVQNIPKIIDFLKTIPWGFKKKAVKAMADYFIGNQAHGLSHDDPYQQTTRAAVYGRQWESEAQRKYVMAHIRSGDIVLGQRKYIPTIASGGYTSNETQRGYTITNTIESAFWSRVWAKWPRWRHFNQVIKDNMNGAMRAGIQAMNRWLKEKGK